MAHQICEQVLEEQAIYVHVYAYYLVNFPTVSIIEISITNNAHSLLVTKLIHWTKHRQDTSLTKQKISNGNLFQVKSKVEVKVEFKAPQDTI